MRDSEVPVRPWSANPDPPRRIDLMMEATPVITKAKDSQAKSGTRWTSMLVTGFVKVSNGGMYVIPR
jgi:hypothetical protein